MELNVGKHLLGLLYRFGNSTRRILPYLTTWNLGQDVCLDAPLELYNWIPYSVMMSRDVFVTFEHLVNDLIS